MFTFDVVLACFLACLLGLAWLGQHFNGICIVVITPICLYMCGGTRIFVAGDPGSYAQMIF